MLSEFECWKFVYCSDAGLASEDILSTLRSMNFADIASQGSMPAYQRTKLTDALHDLFGFRSDFQFITKSKMKSIQKLSKNR